MAITAALLLGALRLRAGDPASMNQHYLVELSEAATAVDDPDAVATELAQTYGGHPEAPAPGRIRGFAMTMSAPEARLLAADPRVKAVRETTAPSALKQAPPRRIIADDVLPPITVGPFKYDGAGNIIHMGTDRYTYDEMSRITSGTAVTAQNADTQQFGYDGFGNLKTVTVPNKSIVYIDSDPSTNRLRNTSGSETGTNVLHFWGGSYDAAGNQLWSSGTPSYIYDSMNMLAEMTNPRHEFYLYDGDDERVATVSYTDAQNAVWRYTIRDEDSHVLRTVTDTILSGVHSWQQTEDYVYRTGGLLAAITPQGSTEARKHFHLDHLGSAVLITDDSGQRVSSHKFLPFGAEAPGGDTDGERMKFTGHERDVGSLGANGLDYMHARYYNPSVGRFLSVDPVISASAMHSPQLWNRYAYVGNNPLRYADPTGKYICGGTDTQCNDFEKARQASLQSRVASEAVKTAASSYGDPNKDNGITVGFGDPGKGKAGTAQMHLEGAKDAKGNFTGAMQLVGNVTIRSGLHGTQLQGVVAHEGSHLADGQAFAASFTNGGLRWNPALNLTGRQTEMNAYAITAQIATMTHTTFSMDGGTFQPNMLPAAVSATTESILRLTYDPGNLAASASNWDLKP